MARKEKVPPSSFQFSWRSVRRSPYCSLALTRMDLIRSSASCLPSWCGTLTVLFGTRNLLVDAMADPAGSDAEGYPSLFDAFRTGDGQWHAGGGARRLS